MYCKSEKCLNVISPKGRSPYCSKCRSRRFRSKYRVKSLYYIIKSNARRRGIGFYITLDEWIIWCIETNYHKLVGLGADDMTVDRIKTNLPYRIDNIQMMSRAENTKKRNDERKNFLKNYVGDLKGDPNIPF